MAARKKAVEVVETKEGYSRINVELRQASKGQGTAFVGGIVDGKYKSFTIELKKDVEIPAVLVKNLEDAYIMGMGDSGVLEPTKRYIVSKG